MDSQLPSEKLFEAFSEGSHSGLRYHPEIVCGPSTSYQIIKDYMIFRGVSYRIQSNFKFVSRSLVNMIYTDNEDRTKAFALFDSLTVSKSFTIPQPPSKIALKRHTDVYQRERWAHLSPK